MKLKCILLLSAVLLQISAVFLFAAVMPADRPNIVLILSDDMGFSDLGCYGSEIATPNLDALAAKGVRFTQFYNTARCCPTRASLLTGLYPHQAGIGHMMSDWGKDGYRGDLNGNCVTIAEVLKPAGYKAYAVGKWHVTKATKPQSEAEKHNWPLQRGFDRFYGTIHGGGSFFDPCTLTRDNAYISPFNDPEYPVREFYYTDAISDHAVRFVREHEKGKPFFMYVAFTAAHWPMHAREKDIAKYKGRYAAGYEAVRKARYQKMLKEGVVNTANSTLWPMPPELGEKEYWEWDQRNMEVFAAMVDCMDQGIGRIVVALKESGHYDNTLILFLQDNGGCAEGMGRGPKGQPRADSATLPPLAKDYLQPDMIPKQTRDGFPMRQGKGVMAGAGDTFIGYGEAWAAVSDTPFRKYKHWVHEGGISTPLIAHWPAGMKNARQGDGETGRFVHTPGHLIDIMATAVDLAGATYPKEVDGRSIKPMEGVSLRPLFVLSSPDPAVSDSPRPIFWEHEGNRAIRVGEWKLVADNNKPWELYNIAKDRSEQHDLSGQEPERVRKMADMWDAYAKRANVEPWDEVHPKKQPKAGKKGKNRK